MDIPIEQQSLLNSKSEMKHLIFLIHGFGGNYTGLQLLLFFSNYYFVIFDLLFNYLFIKEHY